MPGPASPYACPDPLTWRLPRNPGNHRCPRACSELSRPTAPGIAPNILDMSSTGSDGPPMTSSAPSDEWTPSRQRPWPRPTPRTHSALPPAHRRQANSWCNLRRRCRRMPCPPCSLMHQWIQSRLRYHPNRSWAVGTQYAQYDVGILTVLHNTPLNDITLDVTPVDVVGVPSLSQDGMHGHLTKDTSRPRPVYKLRYLGHSLVHAQSRRPANAVLKCHFAVLWERHNPALRPNIKVLKNRTHA